MNNTKGNERCLRELRQFYIDVLGRGLLPKQDLCLELCAGGAL